jgi:membrane-bound serine protease (ClpP class)
MAKVRRVSALLLVLVGFGGFVAHQTLVSAADPGAHAGQLSIDGAIEPTAARFLSRGLRVATEDGAQFLIVRVDTPGGLFSSTRDMVGDILAAEIPVVAFVAPGGAQAASAGTFVVAAAHVAAMAPGTNIGAASPVGMGGEELPDTIKSKATQDAAAFIRGIAEKRGRNAGPLEETVLSARSFTHSEALESGIIDLTSGSVADLLLQLDGREVELENGENVVLDTDGIEVRPIKRNLVERFLGFLADPNIAFLLLTVGGMGIIVELFSPGLIVPAVVGVISLALAYVALGNLPVNWAGVGLIAFAMVLFFAEMQAPGLGVFGAGGAISFLLGAFLLFGGFNAPAIPSPSFRVSIWMIGSVSAVLFAFLIVLFRGALSMKRSSYPEVSESLVGQSGVTISALDPKGTVRVAGERWSAVSDSEESIPEGEEVIVSDVEGLILMVFKASIARK